jgi:hypothetical protein
MERSRDSSLLPCLVWLCLEGGASLSVPAGVGKCLRSAYHTRSKIAAMPWPPPMHIVARA